jgi:cell division ATPase FtsA
MMWTGGTGSSWRKQGGLRRPSFFKEEEVFYLTAPEHVLSFEKRLYAQNNRLQSSHTWTKKDLTDLLEKNGLIRILDSLTHQALNDAGKSTLDIDYVIMVGGSTLLPGVYPFFSELFRRKKVQAWQPFNAVAYGACAFGNRGFHPERLHRPFLRHQNLRQKNP